VLRKTLIAAYCAAAVGIAVALVQGWSFYASPLPLRARHPDYWTFKAGGSLGHLLGVTGSALIILLLGYSLRKRAGALRRVGALAGWLDVHIFMGVTGPLLVILHSTFKVQGLVALSFWSMIIVAVSGFVGRYLYLQIPRSRNGDALSLAEAERLDGALATRLRNEFGLDDRALRRLDALSTPPAPTGLWALTVGLLTDRLSRGRELRAFARDCRSVPPRLMRQFTRVVQQKNAAHRRIVLWDHLHALFHYWHVIHKPFAVVMYLFMIVHVAVALMTGYGWR
jgi:hypothetical protein